MHPNTTKDRFIELRAQGLSLSRIADQLSVSKRTLIDWNRERQNEISSLRALELEALHEKVLASHEQELTFLATWQRKLDSELVSRPIDTLPTEKLLRLSLLLRREIRDLCKPSCARTEGPESTTQDPPPISSSPIKPDQADQIVPGADTPELLNSQTPQLPNCAPGGQSSPIKVNQADQVFSAADGAELLNSETPQLPNCSQPSGPPPLHHSACSAGDGDQSSPIKVNQADQVFSGADAAEPSNSETPQLPNCSQHSSTPPLHHSACSAGDGGQSSPIKVNQADQVFSGADAAELSNSETPQLPDCSQHSSTPPLHHSVPLPVPAEHCLHCGDPLPALMPDGLRPSPWCSSCGSPICAPPGFSIREHCPGCGVPVPVHGYNIKRFLGKCAECDTMLPNLDVNAPLKWLPPASELQKLATTSPM